MTDVRLLSGRKSGVNRRTPLRLKHRTQWQTRQKRRLRFSRDRPLCLAKKHMLLPRRQNQHDRAHKPRGAGTIRNSAHTFQKMLQPNFIGRLDPYPKSPRKKTQLPLQRLHFNAGILPERHPPCHIKKMPRLQPRVVLISSAGLLNLRRSIGQIQKRQKPKLQRLQAVKDLFKLAEIGRRDKKRLLHMIKLDHSSEKHEQPTKVYKGTIH